MKEYDKDAFSAKQWKLNQHQRRCKECVDAGRSSQLEPPPPASSQPDEKEEIEATRLSKFGSFLQTKFDKEMHIPWLYYADEDTLGEFTSDESFRYLQRLNRETRAMLRRYPDLIGMGSMEDASLLAMVCRPAHDRDTLSELEVAILEDLAKMLIEKNPWALNWYFIASDDMELMCPLTQIGQSKGRLQHLMIWIAKTYPYVLDKSEFPDGRLFMSFLNGECEASLLKSFITAYPKFLLRICREREEYGDDEIEEDDTEQLTKPLQVLSRRIMKDYTLDSIDPEHKEMLQWICDKFPQAKDTMGERAISLVLELGSWSNF